MRITRLRNKLLFSVVAISILMALASMFAVSLVIRQQHLDQSNTLLRKAAKIIDDSLAERKEQQLSASRRLAMQKNFGSSIWYLTQYAQSDVDREVLFNSYRKLVKDTYELGRLTKLSKTTIYDSAGNLVSFALLDGKHEMLGFVERFPTPLFQLAVLKEGEELSRQNLKAANSIAGLGLTFGTALPQQESVHYAVVDGLLAIESYVPIVGQVLEPNTDKQETKQLGLVVTVHTLDQAFIDQLSRLTDVKINVFTPQGFSVGNLANYQRPDWNSVQARETTEPASSMVFNEIKIGGTGFYQGLMSLYSEHHQVGTIVVLHSKEIVQKNTWQMIQTLGLIAVACLVFIFPVTWYFATSISHPLTTLSRIFRGVASNKQVTNLDEVLSQLEDEKNRHDELGDLTQSFIVMANAVKQKMVEIREMNASLEDKITQSTAQLRAAYIEMARLANTDELTGLYNRRAFFEIASLAHAQAKRSESELGFIMIDIDHFKSVNDRYGHPVGDEVLRRVAHCLAATARESDTVARYGGEEFAVLVPDTDLAAGVVLAERIREALRVIVLEVDDEIIRPTVSLGVACLRNEESLKQLCVRADAAMYLAKQSGRDRTMVSS
ncbi:MAG: GGDEF domain-containing protein [Undibacterium sp.]|uniref:GGDEF domain-containing protein n=1 Tax=Undibacterium sp. TaxID=1914977 RepID=UPI00271B7B7C|nr:GGDEF domain-containing protein [Undibacterium sp.]MDO8652033.1 GGDEF domain-containing protein [Undibacterium sp.]